jgi:hypothetical protein
MNGARLRLAAICALFCIGAVLQSALLPLLEGGDEWLQVAYVEHLRQTGTLPNRAESLTSPIRQQSGQPPLTYALTAAVANAFNLPPINTPALYDGLQAARNLWFAPPNRFNRADNNNVFLIGNAATQATGVQALTRLGRGMAVLWGIVGIVGAYAAARKVFHARAWALTVAALYAFTPTLIHVSSFQTTDSATAAFGAWSLWAALMLAQDGVSVRRVLIAGGILGAAGLAKVSGLLLAPAVGVGLIWGIWQHKGIVFSGAWRMLFAPYPQPFPLTGEREQTALATGIKSPSPVGEGFREGLVPMIGYGLLLAVPILLTFGVWVLWGILTSGDPLGTTPHRFPGQYFDPPLGIGAVLARLPEVYLSYWGKFASAVYLHPVTYSALTAVVILAICGVFRRGAARCAPTMTVIAVAILFPLVGLVYWLATINFITGRLLYPAHAALMIAVAAGLQAWGRGVFWRAVGVIPVAVAGLILAPLAIYTAYRPPTLLDALPPLRAPSYTFDDSIQLLGWNIPRDTIRNGERLPVTLCWRVLNLPSRGAAYALKIVENGVPVGERTTFHGLGRYPVAAWQVGATFCDRLEVPIGVTRADARYDVLVVLLDPTSGATDWVIRGGNGNGVQYALLGAVWGYDR